MMQSFHIKRLKASELDPRHWDEWTAMRAANAALYSPYFHPDYTRAVSRLSGDAYIAIIKQGGEAIGFLPFQQRQRSGQARPIGAPMTDYHGIVSAAPLNISTTDILSEADIGAIHMPHLMNPPQSQNEMAGAQCAVMSLKDFKTADEWRTGRDSSYNRHLKSLRRRTKKIEAEKGERAFIWQSQDLAHFDLLMDWKIRKFHDTGKYNVLGVNWTRQLLKTLWEFGPDAPLRCDLHVMMVDGRPAAMDLGLTDGTSFHSWIVGYDNDLHSYSPGMQLLEALISEAAALGYENIDLGAGLEGYKKHYASWPQHADAQLWLGRGMSAHRAKFYAALETKGQKTLKDIPGKFRRRYSQISACDSSLKGQTKAMWQAIKNSG